MALFQEIGQYYAVMGLICAKNTRCGWTLADKHEACRNSQFTGCSGSNYMN